MARSLRADTDLLPRSQQRAGENGVNVRLCRDLHEFGRIVAKARGRRAGAHDERRQPTERMDHRIGHAECEEPHVRIVTELSERQDQQPRQRMRLGLSSRAIRGWKLAALPARVSEAAVRPLARRVARVVAIAPSKCSLFEEQPPAGDVGKSTTGAAKRYPIRATVTMMVCVSSPSA